MAMPRFIDTVDERTPLHSGDQLSLTEFRRVSAAHPEIKKAELIDGTVFVEMTVGSEHADIDSMVAALIGVYRARRPHIQTLSNGSVLIGGSEVQPDAAIRFRDNGTSKDNGVIEGPPELVVEVSASSYAYDST